MPQRPTPPFASVEVAWFAIFTALAGPGDPPAWVADVTRTMDRLYRNRRLDLLHARILRYWGLRGQAPLPSRPRERSDWRVWREAMDRLEGPLRASGLLEGSGIQELEAALPDAAD